LILAPSLASNAEWVPIGKVTEVNAAVSTYEKLCRSRKPSEAEAAAVMKSLYGLVWLPIQRKLPATTKHLIVAPAGAMERVSIAALWTGSRFLADDFSVCYVNSARALARKALPRSPTRTAVIVSNPEFGPPTRASANPDRRSTLSTELSGLSFTNAPATVGESLLVSNLAANVGMKVDVLSEGLATEANVRRIVQPTVLHFATHGYWLRDPLEPAVKSPEGVYTFVGDSAEQAKAMRMMLHGSDTLWMFKSWLLLSGCNEVFGKWQSGNLPDLSTDGVLTAGEMGQMDLRGTWLVCLSACESGLGEDAITEGVFGFRRGASLAGAQNVLLTLWPVADHSTMEFMGAFYQEALKSQNPTEALSRVQRRMLKEWREEPDGGILKAMKQAGPFVMNASALLEP
jgi:CHAT domain-containing protein